MKNKKIRATTATPNVPILVVSDVSGDGKRIWFEFENIPNGIWSPFEGIFLLKIDQNISDILADILRESGYRSDTTMLIKNVYKNEEQQIYKNLTDVAVINDFAKGGRFLLSYDTDEHKIYLVQ